MKTIRTLGFAIVLLLSSKSFSHQNYLDYLNQFPSTLGPYGNYSLGEIEIIRDKHKIQEVEELTKRQVGIIAQDRFWIWLNDAVRFPNGQCGVYGRVIWRRSLEGIGGVAIMPILSDGRIVLNRNYRHATRSWEYELPRGCLNENESQEQAALRELKEETGFIADELGLLGYVNPDSGMTNTVMPVYSARVLEKQISKPEQSEAIASVEAFSIEEIKKGFLSGYLVADIQGKSCHINLRDPFLAFAVLQGELRHLFQKRDQ